MSLKVQLLTSAQHITTLSEPWTVQWLSNKLTRECLRFREANLILSYCTTLNKLLKLPEALRKHKSLLNWESKPHQYDLHPYAHCREQKQLKFILIINHTESDLSRDSKTEFYWGKLITCIDKKFKGDLEGTSRKKKKEKKL